MTTVAGALVGSPAESHHSFEGYRDGLLHDWLRTLCTLGFCLVPLFIVLDYLTMPDEFFRRFAVYRTLATAGILLQFFIVRATKPNDKSFIHGYVLNTIISTMIIWMTVDLGGFDSGYYAGLNLLIVAVNVMLPWRAIHSAINGLATIASYVGANMLFGGPFRPEALINNLYFLTATLVIVVAIGHIRYKLIEREFLLRAELEVSNVSLGQSRLQLASARDALWGEMEVAKRIQTAILPRDGKLGGWDAHALMLPADEVGGDYYDLMTTRHREQWVAVGDVSGHGVESGLVMMMTQTSIASLVNDRPGRSPSDVFSACNRVLRENITRLDTNRYMTLNVLRLHEDRIVVAGKHQDLLVWRKASGSVEQVENSGCWIGVMPETDGAVEDLSVPVGQGDLVLLFSDGVTEAMNAGGQMFGQERLVELFKSVASRPNPEVLAALIDAVKRFQAVQSDDITVVLLRRES
jgi:sigma-B regulation protein RsbU (phosphoserine phosphatase)